MGLFLMLWLLIPLPIICYAQLPMKYLLPCTPAVIHLCFWLMEGALIRVARAAALILIVTSTCYSLVILRSDAEFANFGRDPLYRLITPWLGQHLHSRVALTHTNTKSTARGTRLFLPPQPKPGDLLVVDRFAEGLYPPLARFPHRTLVETVSHKYHFGRTIGLYSNGSGLWLWGFGDSGKDRFELWRID